MTSSQIPHHHQPGAGAIRCDVNNLTVQSRNDLDHHLISNSNHDVTSHHNDVKKTSPYDVTKPPRYDVPQPTPHAPTSHFDSNVEVSGPQGGDLWESTPLLEPKDTASYARRWYVLGVFSLAAAIQGGGWATWGPITQSAKAVFGWSDASVALQPLWGNLAYILVMVPVTWLMDVKGLRIAMVFSAFSLAVGFSLRCVSTDPNTATWCINIGQILIGVGGSVPFSGVSLIAATWFCPNERATATAIASIFSYVGVSASFIVGPLLVPALPNTTETGSWNISLNSESNFTNLTEAGLAGFLLLLILVYFPAKPPRPPSRTASLPRTEFGKGVRALLKNRRFWIIAVAYSVPVGTYGAFGGIMDIDLNPTGISQTTAGWLGFYSTIGGCVASLMASRVADLFMRRLKLLLLLLFVGAAGALVWFCLLVLQYIHFDLVSVYASSILTGVFVNGGIPLFYEAACEVTYPVAEGVTTGVLTALNNIVGVVFFALLFVPGIGVAWMNWMLLGTVLAALPLLLMLREHYARIDIDTANMEIDVPDPST
ncbi:solute carrier family 49 member 4 homolog [Littorina saxatilis]|uniref:solute carrier family 49 member 4 homolog n=1 Tax=Littorina saxatilis TaxID=31220 RepID=UPI0038B48951